MEHALKILFVDGETILADVMLSSQIKYYSETQPIFQLNKALPM